MTLNTELTIVSYANDNVTLDYTYNFTATEDSVIKVTIGDGIIPTDDDELVQVTEYTVTRNPGDVGGTITLVNRGALPAFDVISIIRNTAFDQVTTYPTFYSSGISEGVADETVKQTQQLNDRVGYVETVVFENSVINPPNDINRIPVIDNTEGKAIFRGSNLTDNGSIITAGVNISALDIDADNIDVANTLTASDINVDDITTSNISVSNTVTALNVNATNTINTPTLNATDVNADDIVASNSITSDAIIGNDATVVSLTATTSVTTPKLELGTTEITASNSNPINFNLSGATTGQEVSIDASGGVINLIPIDPASTDLPDPGTGNPGEVPTVNSNATSYELQIPREELEPTPTTSDLSLVTIGDGTATWQIPRPELPNPADGLPGQTLQVDPTQTRFIYAENSGGGGVANVYYVGDVENTFNLNQSRFIQDGSKWIIKETGQEVVRLDGTPFDLTQYPELQAAFGFSDAGTRFILEDLVPNNTIDFDVSSDNSLTVVISSTLIYVKDGINNSYTQVSLANTGFRTVSVKPDGSDILVGGNNGNLYRSQTRGLQWTALDILQGKTVNSIDYGTTSILFGFNDGTVGTTTNLDNLTIFDIGNTTPIRDISLAPNGSSANLCGDRGLIAISVNAPNFFIWTLENNPVTAYKLPEYTVLEAVPFDFDQIINWAFSLDLGTQEGLDGTALDDTTLNRKINLSRETTNNYYNFWTGAAWNEIFSADPEETFVFVTSAEWFRLTLIASTYQLYSGTYNALASTLVVDTTYTDIALTASAYDVIAIASDNEITTYDATGLLDTYTGAANEVFTNDLVVSDDGDVVAAAKTSSEAAPTAYAFTGIGNTNPSPIAFKPGMFTTFAGNSSTAYLSTPVLGNGTILGTLTASASFPEARKAGISFWIGNINYNLMYTSGANLNPVYVYEINDYTIDANNPEYTYSFTLATGSFLRSYQFTDDNTSDFIYGVIVGNTGSSIFTMTSSAITENGSSPFGNNIIPVGLTKLSETDRSYVIGINVDNNSWYARKVNTSNLTYDGSEIDLGFTVASPPADISINTYVLRVGAFEYRLCYRDIGNNIYYRTLLDDAMTADGEQLLFSNTSSSIVNGNFVNSENFYQLISFNSRYSPDNPAGITWNPVTTSETDAIEGVIYTRDNRYMLAAGRFGAAKYMLYEGNSAANSMITFNNDLYASGDNTFGVYATTNNRFILFGGDGGQSAYFEYNGNDIDIDQTFTEITSSFADFGFASFTETTGYIFGIAGNRILYQVYDGTSIGATWLDLGVTSNNLEDCIITSDGTLFMAVGASNASNPVVYWFELSGMPTPTINTAILNFTFTGTVGVTYSLVESNEIIYLTNTGSYYYFNLSDGTPITANWGYKNIISNVISSRDLKATLDGKYLIGTSAVSTNTTLSFRKIPGEIIFCPVIQDTDSNGSNSNMDRFLDTVNLSAQSITGALKSIAVSPDGKMIALSFDNGGVATGVYAQEPVSNTLIHRFSDSLTVSGELADLRMAYIDPLSSYVLFLTQDGTVRRYTGADYGTVDDILLADTEIKSTVKTLVFDSEQGIYFIIINLNDELKAIISLDGGITWTSTVLADQATFGYTAAYSASLDDYATPTKLYIQTDVGVLVADIIVGVPSEILRSIKTNNGASNRYACGDNGTLLANDGSGWLLKSTAVTNRLNTVNIYSDPLEISVAGEGGIFLTSTNGGDTISGQFLGTDDIEHFYSTPDKTFRQYNTRRDVFYSENEGAWIPVPAPLSDRCTASFIYEANNNNIVGCMGTDDGEVAISENFNTSPFAVVSALTKRGSPVVGFALNNPQTRLHVYYADGDIWRSNLNSLVNFSEWETTGFTIFTVKQTPIDKYLFAGSTNGLIYRTLNLGGVPDNTTSLFNITAVGASDEPLGTGVAWAADGMGNIYEGTGSGSTWAQVGSAPDIGNDIVSVTIDNVEPDKRGYLAQNTGNNESTFVVTTDGGTTFATPQTVPRLYNTIGYSQEGLLLSIGGVSASNTGQILYSYDDGVTLNSVTYNSIAAITSIASYQQTSILAILGTERGEVVRLTSSNLTNFNLPFDGYLRWLVATSAEAPFFNWFSIVSTGLNNILDINNDYGLGATNVAYYAGSAGQMYILEDGINISPLTNPFINKTADVVQVATGSDNVYFLNSDGETGVSFNQGASFTLKVTLEDTPIVLAVSDVDVLVSLANGKLFFSNNELSSVTEVDITGIGTIADIAITRSGTYALITNTTGQVFKSISGFQSFREVLNVSATVSLKVSIEGQYAYVVGTDDQGIPIAYYSDTYAESFNLNTFTEFTQKLAYVSSSPNIVVYMTSDLNIYSSNINMQSLILETSALSNLATSGVGIEASLNGNYVLAVGNEQSGTTYSYGGVAKSIVS